MTQHEYMLSWGIYLTGFAFLYAVFWYVTAKLPFRELRQLLRVILAVLLLVPWTTDTTHDFLSPAWIVSISDALLMGPKAFWRAGLALVLAMILAIIISTSVSVYLWLKSRKNAAAESVDSDIAPEVQAK